MFCGRLYLDFCPDPKHFILQNEQIIVKYDGKGEKLWLKNPIYTIGIKLSIF